MKKLETFGYLFMAMLSCFTLGLYASSTVTFDKPIELHRWIMTSFFGLMFLGMFLHSYRNDD